MRNTRTVKRIKLTASGCVKVRVKCCPGPMTTGSETGARFPFCCSGRVRQWWSEGPLWRQGQPCPFPALVLLLPLQGVHLGAGCGVGKQLISCPGADVRVFSNVTVWWYSQCNGIDTADIWQGTPHSCDGTDDGEQDSFSLHIFAGKYLDGAVGPRSGSGGWWWHECPSSWIGLLGCNPSDHSQKVHWRRMLILQGLCGCCCSVVWVSSCVSGCWSVSRCPRYCSHCVEAGSQTSSFPQSAHLGRHIFEQFVFVRWGWQL